jgi:3-hydroxybutyryl-CoA dehydratase
VSTGVSALSFEDICAGQEFSFEVTITAADIDAFAAVTGDISPVHVEEEFALSRGFTGRVVHGAFLVGLASRLVGVHLPGRDCLLLDLRIKFSEPTVVGYAVRVTGTVDQISEATRSVVIRLSFRHTATGLEAASGKATVRFTAPPPGS